jgi:hypothetical protein
MPESELARMPTLVPESNRFACADSECGYIAIDAVMLSYHMHTLHRGKSQSVLSNLFS